MIVKYVLSFVLGMLVAFMYESVSGFVGINIFNTKSIIISGYKLHHSLYGLLFVFLGLLSKKHLLIGFGVGIIVQHTSTDGFLFIQKI